SYRYDKFIQQFILISFYIIAYSIIFKLIGKDINNIFKKYLAVSYYVAILGIFQLFLYLVFHINIFGFLYHNSITSFGSYLIRISSVIDEPGYLSIVLTPAISYYILYDFFPLNIRKFIIFSVFLMTYSAISFLVLGIIILYKFRNNVKRLFIITTCIILIIVFIPTSNSSDKSTDIDNITMRLEDSVEGMQYFDPFYFENLNLSSYALISNLWVAVHAPNRIFGTGLGTHEENYLKTYKSNVDFYGLNSKDAYSLFTRIFSEFGIVGLLILFIFIFKCFNKKSVINICAFFLLFSFILKGGHYVRYGLIFWSFMYFYSRKQLTTLKDVRV
ncbi:MAG: O-antigen ligase family protein, partial [Muribaculaceae bacterium]|nr:O-antigen ligase family protein [Muribaculaceae bacterium]